MKLQKNTFALNGDMVEYKGDRPHLSWHNLVNELTEEQCVAVIECVRSNPYISDRNDMYACSLDSAKQALNLDAMRDFKAGLPATDGELNCAGIIRQAEDKAADLGASRLGVLRLTIAKRAYGGFHGPWDSYARIAVGQISF